MPAQTPMTRPIVLEPEVVGPHSPWPRRRRSSPAWIAATGTATAAVLAHCILPLL